jgi:hypothetical protein
MDVGGGRDLGTRGEGVLCVHKAGSAHHAPGRACTEHQGRVARVHKLVRGGGGGRELGGRHELVAPLVVAAKMSRNQRGGQAVEEKGPRSDKEMMRQRNTEKKKGKKATENSQHMTPCAPSHLPSLWKEMQKLSAGMVRAGHEVPWYFSSPQYSLPPRAFRNRR